MTALPTDKLISCFYESAEDCVKVVDANGTLLSFNPNGLKVMEIDDSKSVLGKDWISFWKGDTQAKAKEALVKAAKGQIGRFEGYTPTFKGNMKYWQVMIAPLHNDYGEVQWLLVVSKDASQEKELEIIVRDQKRQISELKKQLSEEDALIIS
jgi:PAS domain S-box-containing protein